MVQDLGELEVVGFHEVIIMDIEGDSTVEEGGEVDIGAMDDILVTVLIIFYHHIKDLDGKSLLQMINNFSMDWKSKKKIWRIP
jgi:hypothetical protein